MREFSKFISMLAVVALVSMASLASANVWLDETFQDGTPFEQSDGAGNPAEGWDTYGADPLAATVSGTTGYAVEGARNNSKAFEGAACYELESGESIIVGPDYDNPTNGDFQVFQFAISVAEPFPAADTVVGTFSWNHDTDSTTAPDVDIPVFIQLVSTGSAINIVAGRGDDPASPDESGTIGTLASEDEWAYLTTIVQKNATAVSHPSFPGLGTVDQGVHFFNQSTTADLTVSFPSAAPNYVSRDWSIEATGGTIYLDDMYWDGGMESDADNDNPRALDKQAGTGPSAVGDWTLMK